MISESELMQLWSGANNYICYISHTFFIIYMWLVKHVNDRKGDVFWWSNRPDDFQQNKCCTTDYQCECLHHATRGLCTSVQWKRLIFAVMIPCYLNQGWCSFDFGPTTCLQSFSACPPLKNKYEITHWDIMVIDWAPAQLEWRFWCLYPYCWVRVNQWCHVLVDSLKSMIKQIYTNTIKI